MKTRPAATWPWYVVALAVVFVLVQLLAGPRYGIFRDEYYYLACARHLAWGYVDHPPLSIAVLALVRSVLGEGILALRLVPALCGAALILLVARLAAILGGGRFAQLVAAVAMAIVGVVQVITGFYSMNALDLVFWTVAWVLLARWIVQSEPRVMLALGLVLGLGLLNKIGLLVLGAALAVAILFTRERRALKTPAPYLGAGLSCAIFLPHVLWQMANGWPTAEFIANAQRYKIAAMSPPEFLGELVLEQHPANLLVWIVGLGWLLVAPRGRAFRLLGLTVVVALALLLLQRAKPYYAAGLFPVLLAAGACGWETITEPRRWQWVRPVVVTWLVAAGLFFLPLGIPVLPVAEYARWQAWTGIAPAAAEVGHTSELPQHYSDRFGWEELAAEVGRVARDLSPDERSRAVIIARNYGEAGALEYWSGRYDLPPVVSGHNSYALWSPDILALDTVIVVGWEEEDVRESFREVVRAGTLVQPWALEDGLPIWVARAPILVWGVLRDNIRVFI